MLDASIQSKSVGLLAERLVSRDQAIEINVNYVT